MAKRKFRTSKALGQNFLRDDSIIETIVEEAGIEEDDLVIEIGPGPGTLTARAARRAKKLVAVELDPRLIPGLENIAEACGNIEIIHGDILKTDLDAIIARERAEGCRGVRIMGNLPYYITSPIIMMLLENEIDADTIILMVQKEVAERLVSPPGSRVYGAISVAVQYYKDVELVCEVPATCFRPVPKVDSALIRFSRKQGKRVELQDEEMFFRLIKGAFSQRRKTLLNSLTAAGFSKDEVRAGLEAAEIDPTRRAETLSVEDFARLSDIFTGIDKGLYYK